METFRLKVFRTVVDNLTFRQAAEARYLTQPTITLQIKALEEELGVPLFDRTANVRFGSCRRRRRAQCQ
jgi:DNA-binding transcriptional LysR family regulator